MNAVEHIVECYFRLCKSCFTMADVKIQTGNNRQFDLLAYNVATQTEYHVESSVTHSTNWTFSIEQLREIFDKKFRGAPTKREGDKTDFVKGKSYLESIYQTYRSVGFDPLKINRIFVSWTVSDKTGVERFLQEYEAEYNIKVEAWSFRDKILPELSEKISTSNYEDEVLRTLSLIRQRELQTNESL